MWQDVVDLHDFYQTPLGGVTRRLLLARIRALWPDLRDDPAHMYDLPPSCDGVMRLLDQDPRFRAIASAAWQGQPVRLYALAR